MIATPAVPVLLVGGKPAVVIPDPDGEVHTYTLDAEFGSNWFLIDLRNTSNEKKWTVHRVGSHPPTCSCPSFTCGRKVKGENKRVFGPCKHINHIVPLVDFLRALRGETQ